MLDIVARIILTDCRVLEMDKTAGLDLHVLTDLVLVLDVFDQVFASFKT